MYLTRVNDLQVLEWMSDAGIHPSNQMYRDIISFGERSAGIEFEPLIRQKLGEIKLFRYISFRFSVCFCLVSLT